MTVKKEYSIMRGDKESAIILGKAKAAYRFCLSKNAPPNEDAKDVGLVGTDQVRTICI